MAVDTAREAYASRMSVRGYVSLLTLTASRLFGNRECNRSMRFHQYPYTFSYQTGLGTHGPTMERGEPLELSGWCERGFTPSDLGASIHYNGKKPDSGLPRRK